VLIWIWSIKETKLFYLSLSLSKSLWWSRLVYDDALIWIRFLWFESGLRKRKLKTQRKDEEEI